MSETPRNPDPGFYPDGHGALRYWDGQAWTEQTQALPGGPPADNAQTTAFSRVGADAGRASITNTDNPTRPWFKMKRWWVAGLLVVLIIGIAAGGSSEEKSGTSSPAASAEPKATEEPAAEAEPDPTPEPTPEEEVDPEVVEEPELTAGQENALRAAEGYLDYTAFSRKGLIEQLEFEDYSTADATFAVDELDPDWNEQAVKAAKAYLDYSSFSRDGLIQQLEFDGYTREQATYGVSKTGL